jgi:hypothetical protein
MTELATKRTKEIQEQKLALPDDGFHIAPDKIKDQHVGDEMPDAVMEQWRGEKLPGVGIIDAAVAQGKVFLNERLAPGSKDELADEGGSVQAEQRKQNNALRRRP